ncbi:MAG: C39 family peptidase, partial [Actinomycetota bacterium]|nr:C39 family peptidase [Actinomycetota bacterium]
EPEEIWVAEPAVEQVTPEPEVDQVTPEPEVDQVTPEFEVDQVTPDPEVDQVTPEPEPGPFEPVDPTSVVVDPTADTVIGDPGEDAQYWLYQGEFGTCAPTSVAMVLADVLDVPIGSNEDVVQRAVDLGLGGWEQQDDDGVDFSGLYVEDTMALLESYGVDATQSYGDLDTLTAHLEAGSAVMVGVDSSEVNENVDDDDVADTGWNEQSEWNPRGDFDHLLVVTGIDPVNEVVYLNNSNNPDGAGMVIPLDQFMGAWEDSGNAMISTELPDETAATGISDNDIAELTDPAAYEYLPAPDVAQGDDLVEQENTVGLPAVDQPAGEGVLADSSGATSSLAPLVFLPFAFVLRAVSRLR